MGYVILNKMPNAEQAVGHPATAVGHRAMSAPERVEAGEAFKFMT
jgi:hypothetical protein